MSQRAPVPESMSQGACAVTAGRELNALVAQKVFGLVRCTAESHHENGSAQWDCFSRPESPDQGGELRLYSPLIEEAWPVVERMIQEKRFFQLAYFKSVDQWRAEFRRADADVLDVWADTAPAAICLAALKAVSVVVDAQ